MSIHSKIILVATCIMAGPLQAHEFWIEPVDYTVARDAPVAATFRNGEAFSGSALSYIPGRSVRFDMISGGSVRPVPARVGDNPAFDLADLPEGLLTILQETTDQSLTYTPKDGRTGWERFVGFAEHKDLKGVIEGHDARGLSRDAPGERYRRFAKALVAVGDGAGADADRGLRVEFVALSNPYVDDVTGGLPVQLLLEGEPNADAQIEMFDKSPDGTVEITLHRTDADGRATLPVTAGHSYLLDSVTALAIEPEAAGDPTWYTLWAALTFAVPEA